MTDTELKHCDDTAQSLAVDAIEKILSHYSATSAIGAAFDGCITVARKNIRNSTKCGYRDKTLKLEAIVRDLCESLENAEKDYQDMQRAIEEQNRIIRFLQNLIEKERDEHDSKHEEV